MVEERNATSDAAGSARSPRIDVKCVILAERGHQCVNGRNSDKTLIEPYLHWQPDTTLGEGAGENLRGDPRSISGSRARRSWRKSAIPKHCR